MLKKFKDLTEKEILAIAIAAEEEDGRIYGEFADALREEYPSTAEMFEEIFECDQRICDHTIGPVEKNASLTRYENVSGVEIEVSQGVWHAQVCQPGTSLLKGAANKGEFRVSKSAGRLLFLRCHEFAHPSEERIDFTHESSNSQVFAPGFEQLVVLSDGSDFELGQSLSNPFPSGELA